MEIKYFTQSGEELSASDIADINKKTRQETTRNFFAAAGLFGLGLLTWRVLKNPSIITDTIKK